MQRMKNIRKNRFSTKIFRGKPKAGFEAALDKEEHVGVWTEDLVKS